MTPRSVDKGVRPALAVATGLTLAIAALASIVAVEPGLVIRSDSDIGPAVIRWQGPSGVVGPAHIPVVAGNWSTLVMNVSGDAGTWLYAYHPLPAPTKSLGMEMTVEIKTFGSGSTALLQMGPAPTLDEGEGFSPAASLLVPPIVLSDGPIHRTYEERGGMGLGGGAERVFTGVGMAIGSNAPWSVSLSFHIPDNDGETTRPSYVYWNLTGLSVLDNNDRLLGGLADGANRVRLTGEVPGKGMTLMQILYRTILQDGARDIQVEFADGTSFHKRPYWSGQSHTGCGAVGSGDWGGGWGPMITSEPADIYGTFTDVEGDLWAEMVHAEASTEVGLAAVHVPIDPADLPEGHLMGGFAAGWFPCKGTR